MGKGGEYAPRNRIGQRDRRDGGNIRKVLFPSSVRKVPTGGVSDSGSVMPGSWSGVADGGSGLPGGMGAVADSESC